MAGSSNPGAAPSGSNSRSPVVVGGQTINPAYTQQQNTDSLAPMAMFQQYRQSGTMPQQGQFQSRPPMQSFEPESFGNQAAQYGQPPPAMNGGFRTNGFSRGGK